MSGMAKRPQEPPSSEITPEALYLRRREFIKNAALFTGTVTGIGGGLLWLTRGVPTKGDDGTERGGEGANKAEPGAAAHDGSGPLKIASRGRYTVNEGM